MADEKKTWVDAHADEQLTDNAALNHFSQCKNCAFRYKHYFEFAGKRYECSEADGWKKGCCHIFTHPDNKPQGVYNNTETCEYYEQDE